MTNSIEIGAGWGRVDAKLREGLQQAVQTIVKVLGAKLTSVTFFGEVVTGGLDTRTRSVQSVLVLETVAPATLRALAAHGPQLAKSKLMAPVVATQTFIDSSLDTFPLEWLEVQQQGTTVIGPDCFAHLVFDPASMRHQCEREFKILLIGLRNALLATTGREKAVPLIEQEAVDRLMRTLRGFLWLNYKREFVPPSQAIVEIERQIGARLDGIRSAIDPQARHDWIEFDRFYGEVALLAEKADAL